MRGSIHGGGGMFDNLQGIKKEGWISLGIGLPLALCAYFIQNLRFILSYVTILVHELGHAFFSWIFGFWAVPAFDFTYGGGRAPMDLSNRHIWVVAIVYALFVWLFYLNRKRAAPLVIIALFVMLYTACAFTMAHKLIILYMGHGTELVFAGIFFYRTISGSSILNAMERPLYAMLAFFIEISCVMFAIKLLTDNVEKIIYTRGLTVGGDTNDFVCMQEMLGLDSINIVVMFFLACCLIPPAAALIFHMFKNYIIEE